jgi:hypothetical protein
MPGTLRFQGGNLLLVNDPPKTKEIILKLQELQRHNTLIPALQPTNRLFLRWSESGGTGLFNPEADRRELHYDPLPSVEEEWVNEVVNNSPWETFMKKWYKSTLDSKSLAEELCISRTQLYNDWRNALWYFRGRLEEVGFDVRG